MAETAAAAIEIVSAALRICKEIHSGVEAVRNANHDIEHLNRVLTIVRGNLEKTDFRMPI